MIEVKSFKTADNRLFENRLDATNHEFSLQIRGFLQSKNNLGNTGAMTPTQVAETISKNLAEFKDLVMRHTRSVASIKVANEKRNSVVSVGS